MESDLLVVAWSNHLFCPQPGFIVDEWIRPRVEQLRLRLHSFAADRWSDFLRGRGRNVDVRRHRPWLHRRGLWLHRCGVDVSARMPVVHDLTRGQHQILHHGCIASVIAEVAAGTRFPLEAAKFFQPNLQLIEASGEAATMVGFAATTTIGNRGGIRVAGDFTAAISGTDAGSRAQAEHTGGNPSQGTQFGGTIDQHERTLIRNVALEIPFRCGGYRPRRIGTTTRTGSTRIEPPA